MKPSILGERLFQIKFSYCGVEKTGISENPKQIITEQTDPTPKWVKKLQNESWQAEILISGGAFVALISILESAFGFFSFLVFSTLIRGEILAVFSMLIFYGCLYLLIGFFIHLIFRGYWIGLIGLNSVFPKGINQERLAMKGRFSNLTGDASNVTAILKLDELCGQIFALTFLVFFSLSSFLLYLICMLLGSYGFSLLEWNLAGKIFQITFLIIGLFSLIDFLTFGRLKRLNWLAKFYYPLHYVISLITLSFLYRRLYYSLASNIKSIYLFLIIALTQALVVLTSIYLDGASGFDGLLPKNAGLQNDEQVEFLSVKEETVSNGILEVELQHLIRMEESMLKNWVEKHKKAGVKIAKIEDLSSQDQKQLLAETYQLFLDNKRIPETEWAFGKSGRDFLSNRIFIRTVLDVSQLNNGGHELSLKIHPFDASIEQLLGDTPDSQTVARLNFHVIQTKRRENQE